MFLQGRDFFGHDYPYRYNYFRDYTYFGSYYQEQNLLTQSEWRGPWANSQSPIEKMLKHQPDQKKRYQTKISFLKQLQSLGVCLYCLGDFPRHSHKNQVQLVRVYLNVIVPHSFKLELTKYLGSIKYWRRRIREKLCMREDLNRQYLITVYLQKHQNKARQLLERYSINKNTISRTESIYDTVFEFQEILQKLKQRRQFRAELQKSGHKIQELLQKGRKAIYNWMHEESKKYIEEKYVYSSLREALTKSNTAWNDWDLQFYQRPRSGYQTSEPDIVQFRITEFRKIRESRPVNVSLLFQADLYGHNDEERLKVLFEGLKKRPGEIIIMKKIVQTYIYLEEFEKAEQLISYCLEKQPRNAILHRSMGSVLQSYGKPQEAGTHILLAQGIERNIWR